MRKMAAHPKQPFKGLVGAEGKGVDANERAFVVVVTIGLLPMGSAYPTGDLNRDRVRRNKKTRNGG